MHIIHESKSTSSISVVRPNQMSAETSQTSGSLRMSAISALNG